jgi:hypothetical protein
MGADLQLLSGALAGRREQVFVADKVRTSSAADGAEQLSRAAGCYGGSAPASRSPGGSWPRRSTG